MLDFIRNRREKRKGRVLTDGVIDVKRIRTLEPEESLRFGETRTFRITRHGKPWEIGQVSLRFGESPGIYYFGHIGYHVDPPYRGHHYAQRAVRLLRDEIRREGKESVVITTDTDNVASQKTCRALGCMLECVVDVPVEMQKKWELSARKMRFIWDLSREMPPAGVE